MVTVRANLLLWLCWGAIAGVIVGGSGGEMKGAVCDSRVVSAPVWLRKEGSRAVEKQIAHGSIAGGVNMALRGFEVALMHGHRPSFPSIAPSAVCPTSIEWNETEATRGQLGPRAQMNMYFECVFEPLSKCQPGLLVNHVEAFRLSRRLSSTPQALRTTCRVAGMGKEPCTRLTLRKALGRKTLRLRPSVRAAVDKIKANFSAEARLAGSQYAAFQIRRGDKCRGSIREAGCTAASVFVRKLQHALGDADKPKAIVVMTDDWNAVVETQNVVAKTMPGVRVVSLANPKRRGRGRSRLCREGIETKAEVCAKTALSEDPMAGSGRLSALGTFAELWAELELIAEASVAVVGHSSNVGRLVEVLRDNLAPAISVDIGWNPN
eukprot:m.20189 g.20189  ORF g.20189 m.20189 type:complete len:379 (-) comp5544_c0_seq1:359-1495(-)